MEGKHIKNIKELNDSLEIGTASKGKIKVYTDFGDNDLTKLKIDNAIKQRSYLRGEYSK